MADVYRHPHVVGADEIDLHGHANNLRYLHWMLAAAVSHSAAQGWSHEAYERLGAAWFVRSHQIKYLQAALAGDEIEVRTWVTSMKRFSSVRKYRIVRASDQTLLAAAETEWVFVDLATRALRAIPEEVAGAFVLVDG